MERRPLLEQGRARRRSAVAPIGGLCLLIVALWRGAIAASGDARAGAVLARAGADLGRAATAPVGLPRGCRCTDPSVWVGWARGTPRLGGAAPFTGTPAPTGARKSKTGPKRVF